MTEYDRLAEHYAAQRARMTARLALEATLRAQADQKGRRDA